MRGCYISPDVKNPVKRKENLNNWVSKMENSEDYKRSFKPELEAQYGLDRK